MTSQTLTYSFIGGTSAQHEKVTKTITEWEMYANIRFLYCENEGEGTIRISFDSYNGSWSYVGKEIEEISNKKPTMNLGWIDRESSTISASDRGTILHEFGHALGLMHEHQSPARGGKITLKEEGR